LQRVFLLKHAAGLWEIPVQVAHFQPVFTPEIYAEGAVNTILIQRLRPTLIDTPLTHNETRWSALIGEIEATDNPPKQEAAQARSPHVPLKVPWLKPEDVAPAAVFLASDLAAMVTGLATMSPAATTLITSRKRTPSCANQV
jgi:NAD(P)-dependent dehydrogenase (short-subunit alcohol dehydrogenase family)